ncbi:redoxin family protein, partial [Candidatus Propionivibrio aalborgensis]|uniref:redoxin family protein n=1 Tax=Candidatus Propionivibrio aalborgensis TaxID=1860101 RepID=UPI000A8F133D
MQNHVPSVIFKTRVRNDALGGPNPFEWKDLSSDEIFKGKNVVVFSLPGAFTPTCSTSHLPRYEELYDEFKGQGVDAVVCISVNDAFVMFQWGKSQNAKNVFLLPD